MSKRMWSPWRSEYVEEASSARDSRSDESGSLFTRAVEENRDEENLILWRGDEVFVIMNRHPYNNGHMLILPYREVAHYEDLTPEERTAIADTIDRCIRWARHALRPDGFNVGMNLGAAAGAGIPEHLHVHVLPRWKGDTNFMPTTADVKVIPEAMQKTYRKLRQAIEVLAEDNASSSPD